MLLFNLVDMQVNMDKQCPFWPDERECGSKECGIENCDDEVPAVLKVCSYRALTFILSGVCLLLGA